MEAVPKLPLLSFELKVSPEATHFAPKLRQYIAEAYREDPDAYSNELHQLEGLRSAAVRATSDAAGLSAMVRYFCQLRAMQSRFPMAKGQPAACSFTWRNLYANSSCTLADIRFEMACILHNIGALHTQLGASETRTSEDSLKAACLHFQNAAWAFQSLRDQYPQPPGVDISTEIMRLFQEICFAQAQECILDKSIQDTRKPTVIGAVATQVLYYYKNCLALLGPSGGSDTVYEIIGMKLFNYWHRYIAFKVGYIGCLVCLYQGINAEEQQKMGERVAFYQLALDRLNDARKLAKYIEPAPVVQEALTFTNDVVEGKRKAAKNENEFIYHEEVPEKELLTDLKPVCLVKAVSINCNDPEVSGTDLFARLVPMGAHEASSMYSEEKAKLLRKIAGQAEDKTTELTEFMSSLQLEQLDVLDADQKIPQEIVDRCAAMNAKSDIIQSLVDSMNNLAEIINDVEHSLSEIKALIQEETLKEKDFQKAMGPRPPSIVQTELSREYHKYMEAHSRTNESNQVLHKAMTLHIANLKLLSYPLDVLHSKIPSIDNIEGLDRDTMLEMRRVVSKAREMQTQRDCLIQQLREAINSDDITGKLLAKDDSEGTEEVFRQELEKYTPQIKIIEQNLAAQENIINKLTSLYAAYGESRRLLSDVLRKRDGLINALITSYDTYEELLGKSQKGLEFYKKLSHNVNQLLSRLRSTCQVQDEERQQQLATQTGKAPSPPVQSVVAGADSPPPLPAPAPGLKLKDYLPYMKNRNLARNMPPQAVPDIMPADTYYPDTIYPSTVRPPPLGSEAADLAQPSMPDGVLPTSAQNIIYNRFTNPYGNDPQTYSPYNYPTTSTAEYDKKIPDEIPSYAYTSYTPPQFSANNLPGQYGVPHYSATPNTMNTMTTVTDSQGTMGYNPMGINTNMGYDSNIGQNTMTSQHMGQTPIMSQTPNMGQINMNQMPGPMAMGHNQNMTQNPMSHNTGLPQNSMYQNPSMGQNPNTSHGGNMPHMSVNPGQFNPYDQMQGMPMGAPTDAISVSSISSSEHAELNANFAQMQVGNKYEQIVPETDYSQYFNQQYPQSQTPHMSPYNMPSNSQSNVPPTQDYNQANPQGQNQPNNPYKQNTNQYNAVIDVTSPYNLQTVPNIPNVGMYNQEYGYTGTSGHDIVSQATSFYTNADSSFTTNVSTAAAMGQAFTSETTIASNHSLAYLDALDQPIKSHVKREAISAIVPEMSNYSPAIQNYPTSEQNYQPTSQQYSNQTGTSTYNQTGTSTYNQNYQNHPGYSFNNATGAYDYNYGSQSSFNNYASTGQENINPQSMGKDQNWSAPGVYTNAGACQTMQSPSEVPSLMSQGQDPNQVYYNSPYGYQAANQPVESTNTNNGAHGNRNYMQSGQVQNNTNVNVTNNEVSTPIEDIPEPTYVYNETYSNVVNPVVNTIVAEEIKTVEPEITEVNEPQSTQEEPEKIPTAFDLLSDIDFTVKDAPLTPDIKVPQIAESLIKKPSSPKLEPDIIPEPIEEVIQRPPRKEIFSDPSLLNEFTQEVKKLQNLVDSLSNKTSGGLVVLDTKWKILQDLQGKVNASKSKSAAMRHRQGSVLTEVVPYDDCRVVTKADPHSYINASYYKQLSPWCIPIVISSSPEVKNYSVFWKAVLEKKINSMVCLQTEIEMQGDAYWPTVIGQNLELNGVTVSLTQVTNTVNWIERKLIVTNGNSEQTVLHYQINVFPAKIVCSPLVMLVDKIISNHDASLWVQCISGSGRSSLLCSLVGVMCEVRAGNVALCGTLDNILENLYKHRSNVLEDTKYLADVYRTALYYVQGVLVSGTAKFNGKAVSAPTTYMPNLIQSQVSSNSTSQKNKFSRESFEEMKQSPGLKSGDMKDPLNFLDPLWSLKKK